MHSEQVQRITAEHNEQVPHSMTVAPLMAVDGFAACVGH